jgi:hypothetical protein
MTMKLNSTKRLSALAALALVGTCVAVAAGSATASRSATPAMAIRLQAHLSATQEVPAVQSAARGHWTAVLIRTGVGSARVVTSIAGCKVVTPPKRSGLPTRINCGGTVFLLPTAPGQWRLVWHLATTGLSGPATGVQIHLAPVGGAAPAMLSLCGGSCTASGHMIVSTDQANAISDGTAYVNLTTAAHPSGEIRGQIVKAPFGTFGSK